MNRIIFLASFFVVALATLKAQNPPTPTDLVAQNTSGNTPGVSLTWRVPPPPGPWHFKVYRSNGDSSHFEAEGWSFMTSFLDHEVLLSNTYYYYVTSVAYQESTLAESPRSNIAQVTVTTSRPHGRITGTVTADANGQPIASVRIRVYRLDLQPCWSAPTISNPSGQYQVEVDTGMYFVKAEAPEESPYRSEWYNNAPSPSNATAIRVDDSSTTVVNFGLASSSPMTMVHVHGTVRNSGGAPLSGASVVFMRTMQEMNFLAATTGRTPGLGNEERIISGLGYTRGVIWPHQFSPTNQFGEYYALVPAGASYIVAAAKNGYMPQYFNNKSDPTQADIITVSADTGGIDFTLSVYPNTQNSVRGTVRDSTGQPVPSRVILFPKPPGTQPPAATRFVHSDTLGNYEIGHVVSGVYNVLAVPYSNFAAGFYKEGAFGVFHWQDADSIIASGLSPSINIGIVPVLSPGLTRIAGRVSTPNGSPVAGSRLVTRTADGQTVGYGVSDGDGNYTMDAVPIGQVTVFSDRNGYTAAQGTINIPPNTFTINSNFVLGGNGATDVELNPSVPFSFELAQSYPNPFNPSTMIRYNIPERARVVLKVFNVLGKEVATLVDEIQDSGSKSVRFDAGGLASGLYFYRLQAGGFVDVKKTLLLK